MGNYYLYIVLTRPNTVLSKIIRLIKNDEYTHAAISLDRELNQMYSFGRKYAYNPFIGRFKREEINEGLNKLHKYLPCLILRIEVSKEDYEKVEGSIKHFISNRYRLKYNYLGLLHGLFNKSGCFKDRFLCSEFVYYILKENGIADFGRPGNLVRPQDLLSLKGKIIYKGNLKEYDNPIEAPQGVVTYLMRLCRLGNS